VKNVMQRLGVGHHQAVLLLGSFRSTGGTNSSIYRNEREPSPPSTHDDAMRRRYDASIQTRNLPPHSDRECHLRFLEGVTVHRRPSVLLANPCVTEKQQRKENVDFPPKPALTNPERRRLRTLKLAQDYADGCTSRSRTARRPPGSCQEDKQHHEHRSVARR
jgi:hypothetical protein